MHPPGGRISGGSASSKNANDLLRPLAREMFFLCRRNANVFLRPLCSVSCDHGGPHACDHAMEFHRIPSYFFYEFGPRGISVRSICMRIAGNA